MVKQDDINYSYLRKSYTIDMFKNIISIPHNKRCKFAIYACLVIAWMGVIFALSAQQASSSSTLSNGVIDWLKQFLLLPFIEQELLSFIVRKSAHFFAYACLSILCFQMLLQTDKKMYAGRLSLVICILYACSDEVHQSFIPGRACMIQDVGIDTSGAVLGVCAMILIHKIIKYYRKNRL